MCTNTGILEWGGRFKSEMDNWDRIWVRISRERKISVLVLLIAKGLSKDDILENVHCPNILTC